MGVTQSNVASLSELPTELLVQIFSYLDPYQGDRVLGSSPTLVTGHYESVRPPPPAILWRDELLVQDYRYHSAALVSLASTCRKFYPVAIEQLYRSPVARGFTLDKGESPATFQFDRRFLCLLRTLITHPELGYHVRRLRLNLALMEHGNCDWASTRTIKRLANDMKATAHLYKFAYMSKMFLDILELDWNKPYALMKCLLEHTPRLETLCLAHYHQLVTPGPLGPNYVEDGFHRFFVPTSRNSLVSLKNTPAAHSLKYLKLNCFVPTNLADLKVFPNLHTLDISTCFETWYHTSILQAVVMYRSAELLETLRGVRRLRLDFQTARVNVNWSERSFDLFQRFIQAFQGLQSLDLYAEPSRDRDPFTGLIAFPLHQLNIQLYPFENRLSRAVLDLARTTLYHPEILHARRTTDYQALVSLLIGSGRQLKELRLPGGFWTLPGPQRKPLPIFRSFECLEKLVLPQAAVISIVLNNMRAPRGVDIFTSPYEYSPMEVLPRSLKELKIIEAHDNFLESSWLHQLFTAQKQWQIWPNLEHVQILLGNVVSEIALYHVEQRMSRHFFWKWVDEAHFKVSVGRDDEIPSVCPL